MKWASAGPVKKPRFLASDMIVKDTASGLVWTRDANPAGQTLSWHDAVRFIKTLNDQKYGGHSDWKLPAVHELKKLYTASREKGNVANAFTEAGFHDVQAGDYWSSSTSMFNNLEALSMSMTSGSENVSNKSLYLSVWPVRWEEKKLGAGASHGSPSSGPTGT